MKQRRRYTEDEKEQIRRLYGEEGLSYSQIAILFGMSSRSTVYSILHPDKNRANASAWLAEHKQEASLRRKIRYAEDPEKHRAARRKWRQENPEKDKESSAKFRRNNREKRSRQQSVYTKNNPDKVSHLRHRRRDRISQAPSEFIPQKELDVLFSYFDNRCAYCFDMKPLTLDHIIPVARGGGYTLNNIAPCCKSCNSSKGSKELSDWLWRS